MTGDVIGNSIVAPQASTQMDRRHILIMHLNVWWPGDYGPPGRTYREFTTANVTDTWMPE